MAGAGFEGGVSVTSLGHPAQAEGPKPQNRSSADLASLVRSPGSQHSTPAASTAASIDPTAGNAARNQVSPGGLLGASARTGGGLQQTADGNGIQSGSTTDPASAHNVMPAVDPSVGGQSADGGQFHSSLAQGPLSRQLSDALTAGGYNNRSSGAQGTEASTNAQPAPAPTQSVPGAAADPAGSPGQPAASGGPTTVSGRAPPSASSPVSEFMHGTQITSNAPERASASGAPDYNARSNNGQGTEASANAQSGPETQPSASTPAEPDPAGSVAQTETQGGPTTVSSVAQPSASTSVTSFVYGTEGASNAPEGAATPGSPEAVQQGLAATAQGLPLSGSLQAGLGGVANSSAGDLSEPSPLGVATPMGPVSGLGGAAFTVTGTGIAADTTMLPGVENAVAALSVQDVGISNASQAAVTTLDRAALAGLAFSFVAPSIKSGPDASDGGPGAAPATPGGGPNSMAPIAAIPGSLTPDRPVPAQIAPANPQPTTEAGMGSLPAGPQSAQAALVPGLATNPAPAGLGNPMAWTPATAAGLPAGAWAYGFGPMPMASPQTLLTPGIATAANGRGRASVEGGLIAYAEHRPVLLDVAPVEPQAPSWRLDDTQTLVSVGPGGVASARERAVALYSALIEQGEGLAAVRPGEGFATWDGSPLWLSLAGIAKPGQHGVLPSVAVPGRVQVLRTAKGEWVVEHIGRPSPSSRPQRHEAESVDDDSLLSDVLYGVTAPRDDSDRSGRFDRALTALRFAFGLAPPTRWRSAEAWASVARLCAVAATQAAEPVTPPAETALQAALSVVVSGLAPSPPRDALFVPPLSRERFLKLALSGDGGQIVGALKGLGRTVLDRLRRGVVDDLDRLDTLALAVCLGRLARTIPQPAPNAAASARRGEGPTTQSVRSCPVNEGRRW